MPVAEGRAPPLTAATRLLWGDAQAAVNTTAAPSVDPAVLRSIEDHVRSDTTREVGGVLVGTIDGGVEIEASIPAMRAGGASSSINFSNRVWDEVMRKVSREHPDKQIVGWYHSSPGSGAELSEYDLFVQQRFFDDPKMVALVIDPSSGAGEWFGWHGQEVQPLEPYEPAAMAAAAVAADPDLAPEPEEEPEEEHETRGALLAVIAGIVLLLAGGLILARVLMDGGGFTKAEKPPVATTPGPAASSASSASSGSSAPPQATTPSATAPPASTPPSSAPSPTTPGTSPPTSAPSAPSAPLPGGPTGAASTYVVQPGDSLWAIASTRYGNGAKYLDILAANPGLTERIKPGMTIGLPAGARDGLVDTE